MVSFIKDSPAMADNLEGEVLGSSPFPFMAVDVERKERISWTFCVEIKLCQSAKQPASKPTKLNI